MFGVSLFIYISLLLLRFVVFFLLIIFHWATFISCIQTGCVRNCDESNNTNIKMCVRFAFESVGSIHSKPADSAQTHSMHRWIDCTLHTIRYRPGQWAVFKWIQHARCTRRDKKEDCTDSRSSSDSSSSGSQRANKKKSISSFRYSIHLHGFLVYTVHAIHAHFALLSARCALRKRKNKAILPSMMCYWDWRRCDPSTKLCVRNTLRLWRTVFLVSSWSWIFHLLLCILSYLYSCPQNLVSIYWIGVDEPDEGRRGKQEPFQKYSENVCMYISVLHASSSNQFVLFHTGKMPLIDVNIKVQWKICISSFLYIL